MRSEEFRDLQEQLSGPSAQRALAQLYLALYPRLLGFCRSIVRTAEAAEEIVQDVFIRLWERRSEATSIANLPVYLYVAVRNRSLNYRQWQSRDIIEYFEAYPTDMAAAAPNPEHLLMTKEMASHIERAINSLPPRCRLVFKLVREDGLKYREVAEILDISARTVDTQMTIAVRKIAQAITLHTPSEQP